MIIILLPNVSPGKGSQKDFVDTILLTSFCWRHSVDVILLTSFCWRHSVDAVLLTPFCWRHSVDAVLLTPFCWHHFVDSVYVRSYSFHIFTLLIISFSGRIAHEDIYRLMCDMQPPVGFGKKCPRFLAYKVIIHIFIYFLTPGFPGDPMKSGLSVRW